MNKKKFFSFITVLLFLFSMKSFMVQGAYLESIPKTIQQPDGTKIECFASGDEFFNYLHDKEGNMIMQDPSTGYYVYAVNKDGEFISSNIIVGLDMSDDNISSQKIANRYDKDLVVNSIEKNKKLFDTTDQFEISNSGDLQNGDLNNITIFIRFADEQGFSNSISMYNQMYNGETNSLNHYYKEVSYNKLNVNTTFYPKPNGTTILSYQDNMPRSYYRPYNAVTNPTGYKDSERGQREHALLKKAIEYAESQIPADLNIDQDNNGIVDAVSFMVSGGPDEWSSLLWPHKWSLFYENANIHGKDIGVYNLLLESWGSDITVLAHEMFHTLGAPDLYRYYTNDITPVGLVDIMANGNGHMGAYMKYKYGKWIDSIPEITESGQYTLNPLTSATNNVFKIRTSKSSNEYFVVEYRNSNKGSYENYLWSVGSGLLVYRVNENLNGNAYGPPDEVYVFRPNGTLTNNGQIYSATLSSDTARTSMDNFFLSDGTGNLGIKIYDVKEAGETITFSVQTNASKPPTAPQNVRIKEVSSSSVSLQWDPSIGDAEVKGYEVYRDGIMVGKVSGTDLNPSTPSYTDSGLKSDTTYTYTIKAFDALGKYSVLSTPFIVKTLKEGDNTVTIYYKKGFTTPYIHYRPVGGTWTDVPGVKMLESEFEGYSKIIIDIKNASQLEACFNDGNGKWDSRNGANYFFNKGIFTFENGVIRPGKPVEEDTEAPSQPTGLAVSSKTNSSVSLKWNPSTDNIKVVKYEIYMTGSNADYLIGTTTTPSYIDTAFESYETGRNYRIVAVDAAGNKSNVSEALEVRLDKNPPTKPTDVVTKNITTNSIDLVWSVSTDDEEVAGYEVYRDGTMVGQVTENLQAPSFRDIGLTSDTTYAYTVKAYDVSQNYSELSDVVTAKTLKGADNTVTVYYKRGFTTPYIHYRSVGGIWTNVPGVKMLESEFEGYNKITIDIKNASQLEACFNDGNGKWDSKNGANYFFDKGIFTFENGVIKPGKPIEEKDTEAPSIPTGLAVSSKTNSSVSLKWNPSTDNNKVVKYEIYKKGSQSSYHLVGTTTTTDYTDTVFEAYESTRIYRVIAVDAAENKSEMSEELNVTLDKNPPTKPTDVVTKNITTNSIDLTWSVSADDEEVAGYEVYRNGIMVGKVTENLQSPSFKDTGLTSDTSYTYTVKAYDLSKNYSEASDATIAKTLKGADNTVTVYYKKGFTTPYIHYKQANGIWTSVPGVKMLDSEIAGYSIVTVDIGNLTQLEACFNDGNGKWDSRNGANYFFNKGISTFENGVIKTGKPNQ